MILQEWKSNPSEGANRGQLAGDELDGEPGSNDSFDSTLDDMRQQLEAQLAQYQLPSAESIIEN